MRRSSSAISPRTFVGGKFFTRNGGAECARLGVVERDASPSSAFVDAENVRARDVEVNEDDARRDAAANARRMTRPEMTRLRIRRARRHQHRAQLRPTHTAALSQQLPNR